MTNAEKLSLAANAVIQAMRVYDERRAEAAAAPGAVRGDTTGTSVDTQAALADLREKLVVLSAVVAELRAAYGAV